MQAREKVLIGFDEPVLKKLKRLAQATDRNVNQIVREAVNNLLEKLKA
jgi:predicted transcriptional regulator